MEKNVAVLIMMNPDALEESLKNLDLNKVNLTAHRDGRLQRKDFQRCRN